jgi:hypothetical protein
MMNFLTIRVDSPPSGEPYNVYIPARAVGAFENNEDSSNFFIGGLSACNPQYSFDPDTRFFIKIPDAYPSRPSVLQTTSWLNKLFTAANNPGAPMYGQPIPFDFPIEAVTPTDNNVSPPK